MKSPEEKVNEHSKAKFALTQYLLMKAQQEDWHGVRDAAVDIEILEAKHKSRMDPDIIP